MLHPDPPARAFPGETEFSFLPVSASVAGTKEGSAVICPHVPGSPLLAEWEVPVFASLAGDDNIDGDSYEVGRVYVVDNDVLCGGGGGDGGGGGGGGGDNGMMI